jgi:hypothetical protein
LRERHMRRGALRPSIDINGIFEHNPLVITCALTLGFYTILAGRPFLSTLDAAFSTY